MITYYIKGCCIVYIHGINNHVVSDRMNHILGLMYISVYLYFQTQSIDIDTYIIHIYTTLSITYP